MLEQTCERKEFSSYDGNQVPYAEWVSPCAWAEIVAVHGLGSYGESFEYLGNYMRAQGINVYALDLRGFGRWRGRGQWSYVPLSDNVRDLEVFADRVLPTPSRKPRILLGDSLGCLLVTDYITSSQRKCDGVVFASPFFLVGIKRLARWPLLLLNTIHSTVHVRLVRDLSRVTRDYNFIDFDRILGLGAKWVSARLLFAVVTLSLRVEKLLATSSLGCPLLIVLGGKDTFIDGAQMQHMLRNTRAGEVVLRMYPAGHHLLVNDLPRDEVFADILKFVRDRRPMTGSTSLEET